MNLDDKKIEWKFLVGDGRHEEVFRILLEECLIERDLWNKLMVVKSRYNSSNKEKSLGMIKFEDVEVIFNNVANAQMDFIEKINIEDVKPAYIEKLKSTAAKISNKEDVPSYAKPKFSSEYCHTVNRFSQFSTFEKTHSKVNQTGFYYLYGDKMQKHKGLLARFEHQMKGTYTKNNKGRYAVFSPEKICLSPADASLDGYKNDLLLELFDKFQLPIPESNIQSKRIKDLLKSPKISTLKSSDKVIVYFSFVLSRRLWNRENVQLLIRWLANDFCKGCPSDKPTFYFFFSLEYRSSNKDIRSEALRIAEESQIVQALDELKSVELEDIVEWFDTHEKLLPESFDDSDEYIESELEGEAPYVMNKVYPFLKKTIDKYNEKNL